MLKHNTFCNGHPGTARPLITYALNILYMTDHRRIEKKSTLIACTEVVLTCVCFEGTQVCA